MASVCPHCNCSLSSGERICPSCGITINDYAPDKMKCPICKEIYPKGTKYCLKDGSLLQSGEIDFNTEATMFLSPSAMKKISESKKTDPQHPQDKEAIPIIQSFNKETQKPKPKDSPDQIHKPAHHIPPPSQNNKKEPLFPALQQHDLFAKDDSKTPSADDAFDLYQALTNDAALKNQTPAFSKPAAPKEEPIIRETEKKSDFKPHSFDEPKPFASESGEPQLEIPKLEMTPELLAAKRKLEEKYSKNKHAKIMPEKHHKRSLEEYDKLLKEDLQRGGAGRENELELKPAPVIKKPGLFERIRIAIRVLFPKF